MDANEGPAKRWAEPVDRAAKQPKPSVAFDLQVGTYRPCLADVQNLLLRLFTSEHGDNPKWASVRGMTLVQSAMVLLVPCLDPATLAAHAPSAPLLAWLLRSPRCTKMRSSSELEHFPADQNVPRVADRMVHILLAAKAKPAVTHRKPSKAKEQLAPSTSKSIPIRTYLASERERIRSGFPQWEDAARPGWVALQRRDGTGCSASSAASNASCTSPKTRAEAGSVSDPDRALLFGLDCEMVITASGQALARCTLVGPDGAVLCDTLVRPVEVVTDHLTAFSGITPEHLEGATARLQEVQARVLELLPEGAILIGHSLENDLRALQLVHERVVDTALLYPHARGWPHRHGLAHLSSTFLGRKLERQKGHDSVADARAALDLALLKFDKGPGFGAPGGEPVPLGRLLRAAGARLTLEDAASSASERPLASPWHLESCEPAAGLDAAAGRGAEFETSSRREVRLVLVRDYEALCEAAGGAHLDHAAVGSCLARLERRVRQALEVLRGDQLLLILSGCGDMHRWRRLLDPTREPRPSDAQIQKARGAFRDAFGIFALGGASLPAQLEDLLQDRADGGPVADATPKREIVSYDI